MLVQAPLLLPPVLPDLLPSLAQAPIAHSHFLEELPQITPELGITWLFAMSPRPLEMFLTNPPVAMGSGVTIRVSLQLQPLPLMPVMSMAAMVTDMTVLIMTPPQADQHSLRGPMQQRQLTVLTPTTPEA